MLSVIEVSRDAAEKRLFEIDIVKLCGTTELFQTPIKFDVSTHTIMSKLYILHKCIASVIMWSGYKTANATVLYRSKLFVTFFFAQNYSCHRDNVWASN